MDALPAFTIFFLKNMLKCFDGKFCFANTEQFWFEHCPAGQKVQSVRTVVFLQIIQNPKKL